MEEPIIDEVNVDDTSDDSTSGIVSSNNFLGFLPLPYSMSTLKSSLPSFETSSLSPPPAFTHNNNNNNFSPRTPSTSFEDLHHSSMSTSTTYRRSTMNLSKPSVFNQAREKERFELSALNDRFADYVEKVRYLEAQNKKIQMDSNVLTEKQQENCQKMKSLFETEVAQLKQLAEQLFKDKNTTFTTGQEAQNAIHPLKQRLTQTFKECDSSKYETEKVERQLSTVEGDILMYKRRLAHQDNEHTQWKQLTSHFQRLLLQAKNEIHNEILTRTSSEQTSKQLRLDITRVREQQQQKLKDLKQSSSILGSSSFNDRAHMFRSELSSAIRRIRQDFDRQNELHRNELYGQFTQSYEDIARQNPELAHLFLNDREQERIKQEEDRVRSELQRVRVDSQLLKQKNAELKLHIRELQINLEMSAGEQQRIEQLQENEMNQFKLRHEKITKDYEDVTTKQTSLEKEIETYRNLLEGTMKPVVDHITDDYNSMTNNQTKIELNTDLTNRKNRSASVGRLASMPTNLYTSSMTLKYNNNNNSALYSSTSAIDMPKTTTNDDLEARKINGHGTVENNETNAHVIEKLEAINGSPLLLPRPPIIIQTRRHNH